MTRKAFETSPAGLISMIVVDSHKARFWAQIFEAIQVHDDIAVRTGGVTA